MINIVKWTFIRLKLQDGIYFPYGPNMFIPHFLVVFSDCFSFLMYHGFFCVSPPCLFLATFVPQKAHPSIITASPSLPKSTSFCKQIRYTNGINCTHNVFWVHFLASLITNKSHVSIPCKCSCEHTTVFVPEKMSLLLLLSSMK